MSNYTVQYRQSLLDIALQELGDVAAIVEIAQANNISITEDLEEGTALAIPAIVFKPEIVKFFKDRAITIVTDVPRPNQYQTISFAPIPTLQIGDTYTLNASATSGLTIIYTVSNPSVVSIVGNVITIIGAGTCIITASQPGDSIWYPASASKTIVVLQPLGGFSDGFSDGFNT